MNTLADRGWVECPEWLSPREALDLLSVAKRFHEDGTFKRAGVGRGPESKIEESIRRDEIRWLERGQDRAIDIVFDRLESLLEELNREFFLGLRNFEAHFARYDAGGFYERHVDRFRSDDSRVMSAVLYLNEDWSPDDGGQLTIYANPAAIEIAPRLGTLALFRSETTEHSVSKSHKIRWSLAVWFRR